MKKFCRISLTCINFLKSFYDLQTFLIISKWPLFIYKVNQPLFEFSLVIGHLLLQKQQFENLIDPGFFSPNDRKLFLLFIEQCFQIFYIFIIAFKTLRLSLTQLNIQFTIGTFQIQDFIIFFVLVFLRANTIQVFHISCFGLLV